MEDFFKTFSAKRVLASGVSSLFALGLILLGKYTVTLTDYITYLILGIVLLLVFLLSNFLISIFSPQENYSIVEEPKKLPEPPTLPQLPSPPPPPPAFKDSFPSKEVEDFSARFSILELIKIGILCINEEGLIRYVNQEGGKILKILTEWLPMDPTHIIGTSYFDFYRNPEELKERLSNAGRSVLEDSLDIGREILETTMVPLQDEEHKSQGTMVLWRVITREKNQRRWEQVLEQQIKTASQDLNLTTQELLSISHQVRDIANSTTDEAKDVTGSAQKVNTKITQLTDALKERATMTNSISEMATHGANISQQALSESQETAESISEFSYLISQIGKMTRRIEMVMEQTRMLALNATIEAVNAGKSGKGFVVIADEVRELSSQTAGVTMDITKMIEEMSRQIPVSVSSIESVKGVIQQMNEIVLSIKNDMGTQAEMMGEMNINMQEAETSVQQIVERMSEVVANSQESIRQSEKGLESSNNIEDISDMFRIITERFGEERVVTPSDVFRLVTIIHQFMDALGQVELKEPELSRFFALELTPVQGKKANDVLKNVIRTVKKFLSIFNLPEEDVHFPKGTVTPTQVYNFVNEFAGVVEKTVEKKVENIQDLKNARPVDKKIANDVFALVNFLNDKLSFFQPLNESEQLTEKIGKDLGKPGIVIN